MKRTFLDPRPGIAAWGDMLRFSAKVMGRVYSGRVLNHFGEALRQAGILVTGSVLIVLGLVFVLGLACGIEGAYGARSVGAPFSSGAFTALCNLREITPYAFGYMMAAKVGTGIVAELGSMGISDEIDALEVMGLDSVVYLCATRLLGMWMVLPFTYIAAVTAGFLGSYIAVVLQVQTVSAGGYFQIFWLFQDPTDLLFSTIKGMLMATFVVLVGCYYGYHAAGGPVGVGVATARSMFVNIVGIHVIGLLTTQIFWGGNPRAPIGG
ncbi:MAG: phospholipid/cholesterol/gamma-HCH transport system permease protein [Thermoleophilaceae bacterium]|nr:phospholipid/cholesterol/gamma-HCH transport system permease protein [Thermoleophilaceae bacterium]